MVGFNRGAAVLVSVMIGLIILPLLGIKGLFAIVIIGFIANYLTVTNQRSYLIGAVTGGIIGLIVFICGFFASPVLPDVHTLSSSKMFKLQMQGLFTLTMGFFLLVIVCTGFGTIGGAVVQKIFKNKKEDEKYKNTSQRSFNKYLKLILNRNKGPKRFNNGSGKTLNKNKHPKSFNSKPRRTLKKK